jgi:hypothetical protein
LSLTLAVACAKATEERILTGDDEEGGDGGTGASPFGGSAGLGGTTGTGGKGGAGQGGAGGTTPTGGKGGAGQGGTVATGGTSGSDMGGASDGGEGGTDNCTPVATPPDLRVEYKSSTRPVTEDPEGEFHLVNGTGAPIPLSELTFRYWFTSEFTCAETTAQMAVNVVHQEFQNPYDEMAASVVTDRVVSLGTGAPGCDAYFEIGFTADAGELAIRQIAVVKYYAQIPIYETARPHNQANDYSYGACTTAFVYWERITVYRNGRLVGGTPPGGGGGEGGAGGESGGGTGGI